MQRGIVHPKSRSLASFSAPDARLHLHLYNQRCKIKVYKNANTTGWYYSAIVVGLCFEPLNGFYMCSFNLLGPPKKRRNGSGHHPLVNAK